MLMPWVPQADFVEEYAKFQAEQAKLPHDARSPYLTENVLMHRMRDQLEDASKPESAAPARPVVASTAVGAQLDPRPIKIKLGAPVQGFRPAKPGFALIGLQGMRTLGLTLIDLENMCIMYKAEPAPAQRHTIEWLSTRQAAHARTA
jgi:hypothetical protein